MFGDLHIYGGFRIPIDLAARVFEAVGEIEAQAVNRELSHLDDDVCPLCRNSSAREADHDAAGPAHPGHRWTA